MTLLTRPFEGALLALACAFAPVTHGQAPAPQPTGVLFENVRVFNGTADKLSALSAPSNALVVGNLIKTISTSPIAAPPDTAVTKIAGVGRTLMPGLIDAHTCRSSRCSPPTSASSTSPPARPRPTC